MIVGVARVRHALGDGATVDQAKRVHALLLREGLLERDGAPIPVPARVMGVAEIAEMAGVTTGAVCQWKLPEPIARLRQGRIWDADVIEAFLERRAAQ